VKKFWRYDYSFWHNTRTWQTDGLTDTAWRYRPRLCIASRCNKTRTSETLNHHPRAAVHRNAYSHFRTRTNFWPYLAPIKMSWWYLKRFKSYRVDKRTSKHKHTHTPSHKQTLLKTAHLFTLSLREWWSVKWKSQKQQIWREKFNGKLS